MRLNRLFGLALAVLCASASGPAPAQSARNLSVAAAGEKRVALVIGNDKYRNVTALERASNDARAMGAEFTRLGFQVLSFTNLDRRGMNQAVGQFVEAVSGGGVGVMFFAGHGVQMGGTNYLLPVDVSAKTQDDLADEAIDVGRVMERIAQAKTKFMLMILDACRDNPFPKAAGRSIGGTRGLTIPAAPDGLIVVYSAGINEQALDRLSPSDRDPNGLFTREFVKQLRAPGVKVDDMVKRVRASVREKARGVGHTQNPAIYDQSSGDFYFASAPAGVAAAPVASPAPAPAAQPARPAAARESAPKPVPAAPAPKPQVASAPVLTAAIPSRAGALTGTWSGYATSEGARYPSSMKLQQSGDEVTGTVSVSDGAGSMAIYRVTGSVAGDRLSFEGTTYVDRRGDVFCIASGTVRLQNSDGLSRLTGSWGPNFVAGGCPAGTGGGITMSRQ